MKLPLPPAGHLDLWILDLGRNPGAAPSLDSGERAQAQRFHFARHRRRFLNRRVARREITAAYTGVDASDVVFLFGKNGKPEIAGIPGFSTSHSGDLGLVAIADTTPVGVDIEMLRADLPGPDDGAAAWLSADELRRLAAFPPAERQRVFYRCWARKEAYIKGLGTGLASAPETFSVSTGPDARIVSTAATDHEHDWKLMDLEIAPTHAAALAYRGDRPVVQARHWPTRG